MLGEAPHGDQSCRRFDRDLVRIPSQLAGHLLGTEDHHEIARIMTRYYREYRDLDDLKLGRVRAAFRLLRTAIRDDFSSLCRLAPESVSDGLERWGTRAEYFLGQYSILGPLSPFDGQFVSEAVCASVLYLCLEDHREERGLVDATQTVVIGFCSKFMLPPAVGCLLTRMALRMVQVGSVRTLPWYLLFLTIVARLANNSVRPEEISLTIPSNCTGEAIERLDYLASLVAEDPKVWQKTADYSEYVGDTFVVSEAMRQDFVLAYRVLSAKLARRANGQ